MKPLIRIYNDEGFVDREMNTQEFAQYKKDIAEAEGRKAEAEAKVQAKTELLERLGITEDEAKLLLS